MDHLPPEATSFCDQISLAAMLGALAISGTAAWAVLSGVLA